MPTPDYTVIILTIFNSCRIGAVTGKGLAAVIRENYSKKLLFMSVALVVVANTINIGADLGAMAATTQLFVGAPFELLAVLYAVIVVVLVVFVSYKTYARILKWLAVALLAYPITALLVGQDWPEVLRNTFTLMPRLSPDTIFIFVGMLGTTISPYLFFWDTSEVVEEEISDHRLSEPGKSPVISKSFLRAVRLDNFVGMTLAAVTAWFIVVVCASVLYKSGTTQINTAADAARALEPLVRGFPNAGILSKLIFSVGIIGLGLLAVPVLAGSSSYALSETFQWKEGLYQKFDKATGFYVTIIVATLAGLAINFVGIDPIKALVFTAVFNGVAAVPLLLMIAKVGRDPQIMGEHKSGLLANTLVMVTFVIMAAAVVALLYLTLRGN